MYRDSTNGTVNERSEELLQTAQTLQNLLISHATDGRESNDEYKKLRRKLLDTRSFGSRVPDFVETCRSLDHFWAFIKPKYDTWAERRKYLWDQFAPLLDYLEGQEGAPSDPDISKVLSEFSTGRIHDIWFRALERRESDPEGAITLARTLLEEVCKHILDQAGVDYKESIKLPSLYGRTGELLDLSPGQYSEEVFSQILGGCTAVVEGLGAVRNRLSDSHGRGERRPVRPSERHAALAVNLAGTMAAFLVQTWEIRQQEE